MKFIVHADVTEDSIRGSLGQPDYSNYFVLRGYRRALAALGSVELVQNPETDVDPIFRDCVQRGEDCVFLSFAPPHKTPVGLECPTVPVIAWEFSTIPDEALNDDPRSDWRFVLSRTGCAIVLSCYAVRAIKSAMGPDYRVRAIAVPVAERLGQSEWTAHPAPTGAEVALRGVVLDSSTMMLSADLLATSAPPIDVIRTFSKGNQRKPIRPHELNGATGRATDASFVARWRSWLLAQLGSLGDAEVGRSSDHDASQTGPGADGGAKLAGVVYASVLNPLDGRKNWVDMVSAFCWAFRHTEDATLVLKIVHNDLTSYWSSLGLLLCRLSPFSCRVVVVHGDLEDDEYERLIGATSYYVNSSHCEGICLPLMEFMVRATPAVAPAHTAMADYLDESVAFVVRSSMEPNAWPHDPGGRYRTMRYRIDFESLLESFRESYRLAKSAPDDYSAMGTRARRRMQDFCSVSTVTRQLRDFFAPVGGSQSSALTSSGRSRSRQGGRTHDHRRVLEDPCGND